MELIANYYNVQARSEATLRTTENPYQVPANNETAIYAELKRQKIPDIAGSSIE